ncbi:MAG: AraC family transcriptional regulator [Paenibacillus sp.]|uniref:AraC family transcriptional regulator n=1 Tax=Paenibacillus sp. TaxID=58172 RepID=UPI002907A539|nr:AraC family transcriptional regulator [Paenibacillus sp.]MDU4696194.1 AraC family transcriptional regulator [Paenibacillus sp.]
MSKPTDLVQLTAPPLPYFLECGHSVYLPGDEHPNRRNIGIFDWIVVESGTLYLGEAGQSWSLGAGQSLLLLPDRHHYAVKPCEEMTSFYWLHFHTVCAWQQLPAEEADHRYPDADEHHGRFLASPYSLQLPKAWVLPSPDQTFRLFRQLLESLGERQSRAFWNRQQRFEELLRAMDLRQLESHTSPVVTVAEKAEAYIKSNYRSELNSGQMAEALHYHYNYITRCMKQVYGMTPNDYLLHYRLEQAKLLLLKTEWPIAEIATYVGFNSTPYFSNRFALKNGCSPRAFRKQYVGNVKYL